VEGIPDFGQMARFMRKYKALTCLPFTLPDPFDELKRLALKIKISMCSDKKPASPSKNSHQALKRPHEFINSTLFPVVFNKVNG
tara:strand:- start:212 stop:463 length:252 start_codon:yes stop_codon:yes gene_type:complete